MIHGVEILSSVSISGKVVVLGRTPEKRLWTVSLGEELVARCASRNELVDWALMAQGAKGVSSPPNDAWSRHTDDT